MEDDKSNLLCLSCLVGQSGANTLEKICCLESFKIRKVNFQISGFFELVLETS